MSTTDSPDCKALTPRQRAWLSHLEAWREQGGTLKTYASVHDLSVSGLYTARRLLEQRGVWTSRAKSVTRKSTTPKLIPVRLTSVLPAPAALRVVLPSGAASGTESVGGALTAPPNRQAYSSSSAAIAIARAHLKYLLCAISEMVLMLKASLRSLASFWPARFLRTTDYWRTARSDSSVDWLMNSLGVR